MLVQPNKRKPERKKVDITLVRRSSAARRTKVNIPVKKAERRNSGDSETIYVSNLTSCETGETDLEQYDKTRCEQAFDAAGQTDDNPVELAEDDTEPVSAEGDTDETELFALIADGEADVASLSHLSQGAPAKPRPEDSAEYDRPSEGDTQTGSDGDVYADAASLQNASGEAACSPPAHGSCSADDSGGDAAAQPPSESHHATSKYDSAKALDELCSMISEDDFELPDDFGDIDEESLSPDRPDDSLDRPDIQAADSQFMRYFERSKDGERLEVDRSNAAGQEIICRDEESGKLSRICGIIKGTNTKSDANEPSDTEF